MPSDKSKKPQADVSLDYLKQNLCLNGKSLAPFLKQAPCYVYSKSALMSRIIQFKKALGFLHQTQIHYAMKANSNQQILKIIKSQKLGVDVVSGGELRLALKAGVKADDIVFSGVGKTKDEIKFAASKKISSLNVESIPELKRIMSLAPRSKILLRFNPDVNPVTHPYISTGFKENKFGMALAEINDCAQILKSRPEMLKGISIHIGSQLTDFDAFEEALVKALRLYSDLKKMGFAVDTLDVGGGVGIKYDQEASADWVHFDKYIAVLKKHLHDFKDTVAFEPGRFLVARCGVLITEVQYIKKTEHKEFVIVNSGMNHLIRPALYEAYHRIFALKANSDSQKVVDVVGPVCESSDFFAKSRLLPPFSEGDGLVLADSGAYGMSMASGYNSFQYPKEFIV
jgi:diaminopimelate decarboxylase